MDLKAFFAAMVSVLLTITVLSLFWEFWLEGLVMTRLTSHHEPEAWAERWEFVATTVFFSALALIGPTIIGARIIRRDQVLQQQMIRLSREDHLTSLSNRRWITELLTKEIERATRYDTTFTVILMDVDHFKEVNDRLGHQAGDVVLTKIAEAIRSRVRSTDLVGRWGGEEFVILSPETDIDGGFWLAEMIRTQLETADLGAIGHKTASFGITAFQDGDNVESIFARADAGLLAAKQGGRNRSERVTADPEGEPRRATNVSETR